MKRTLSTLVTLAVLIILTLSVFSKGRVSPPANRIADHVSQANVWITVKEAKGTYNTFAFEYNPDNDGTVDIYAVEDLLIDEN